MPPAAVKMKKTKEEETPVKEFPYYNVKVEAPKLDTPEPLSIVAINVNGIRAAFGKDLRKFLDRRNPDIICFSETKLGSYAFQEFMGKEAKSATENDDTFTVLSGYRHIFCCSTARQGYASSAVFVRDTIPITGFSTKMGKPEFDSEGRFIHVSFASFELIHVYVPNSGRGSDGRYSAKNKPANLGTRLKYEQAILKYIGDLITAGKEVIYCGDLNVAHQEIDLHNPGANHFHPGFTDEERQAFGNLLKTHGLIDSFREMHPNKIKYSWFSNFGQARAKKQGWRIDYFVVTNELFKRVQEVDILDDLNSFSDHVPITLILTAK